MCRLQLKIHIRMQPPEEEEDTEGQSQKMEGSGPKSHTAGLTDL